ncbi:TPA: helix-turn-helix transcriptional regulator [Enterobacter hormaechei subsp. steigerwaltii]|nr:ArsR family transcriptional regulator [Salmonella enterica]RTO73303.1 ArsR family transcriptional regulator [Enterobacter hormaechei]HAV1660962.1 helix-turn-helix transcriptional regulator [Enterobacter hormaechei subsp. steigerwaltii]EAW8681405.1 helix-turn-helix transcriptional regulator [Salmonella enterica]EAX5427163.1 helix-turn-helix transcriptional regulator [Salmonella enterica]
MATILKSAGLTLTTSRIDILHHLTQISTPATASELSKLLDIPLSTTHRNLSVIARAGLASYIIDRLGISRWFLLVKGKVNFCPCCNQEFTISS